MFLEQLVSKPHERIRAAAGVALILTRTERGLIHRMDLYNLAIGKVHSVLFKFNHKILLIRI